MSQTVPEREPVVPDDRDPFRRLVRIMEILRTPGQGCPWDLEQDFASIAPHTLEEAYEVVDAIESADFSALQDELGDLLLQVVFHSQMAADRQLFSVDDVAEGICRKMIRRHPHVFSTASIDSASEQVEAWEAIKQQERQVKSRGTDNLPASVPASALDGVTRGLPAITRAAKLQGRAARTGFDWDKPADILRKLEEEAAELEAELPEANAGRLLDEMGDVLFTAVNLARKLGVDAEAALRHANSKFERRFRLMEAEAVRQQGALSAFTLAGMECLWQAAKATEGKHSEGKDGEGRRGECGQAESEQRT